MNYSTEVFANHVFQTSGIHSQIKAQVTKEIYATVLYRRIKSIFYSTPEQGKGNVFVASLAFEPRGNFQAEGLFTFNDFYRDNDNSKLYEYTISRIKLTYQLNQYIFFRTIEEYNNYRKQFTTDFLASFVYVPGTAVFLGYGSVFNQLHWNGSKFEESNNFLEIKRGLFLKMSYLWRT